MPKFSANLSFLFTDLPFLQRFEAAKTAGFEAVEFVCLFDDPPEILTAELKRFGLKQVLLNIPHGDWAGGERGIAILPERAAEFRASITKTITYCHALDCDRVNCLAGIKPKEGGEPFLRASFVNNLRYAAAELKKAGIKLLIEPINTRDVPNFYLTHTKQAYELIQDVGSDNLFIQHDLYHMQIMEGDLARNLEQYLPHIAHIQIADNPGRHEPGTGEINYSYLLKLIDKLGYAGYVGCEYKPKTTTGESFGWMHNFLSPS